MPDLEASDDYLLDVLTRIRREQPETIAEALRSRQRRSLLSPSGTIFLIAADHPARGVMKAGTDPHAMADRGELLRRLRIGLERPGVDGVTATPDVVEDLALLGALENKVVFGSMNRGGLGGSGFKSRAPDQNLNSGLSSQGSETLQLRCTGVAAM